MIKIDEIKYGNDTRYIKTIEGKSGNTTSFQIHCRAVTVSHNNFLYFLIYNTNMEVLSDAFAYINIHLASKAENTRIKTQEALKILYSYEEICGKNLADFLSSDVDDFKHFLHGYSPVGLNVSLSTLTIRSNETVNGYLSIYRGFLKYLGLHDHCLLTTDYNFKYRQTMNDLNPHIIDSRYTSSEKLPNKSLEVPKYISVEEFSRIMHLLRGRGLVPEEIIIRLMYQCGLRIGEVLGLTADDLVIERLDNGEYYPVAYIRNRLSDNKDQKAKTCMKITNAKQYKSKEYYTLNYGYQYVVVPRDLFDLINGYIETAHIEARNNPNKADRYFKNTIADRTHEADKYEEDNYYVFINSVGTPLSASTWNNTLRNIYSDVGIPVDKEKKANNLNHRFRHGYAMFNVQHLCVKEVQLARLLRHSGLSSLLCYYRPTISDQIKLKAEYTNSLYDIVPELKRED